MTLFCKSGASLICFVSDWQLFRLQRKRNKFNNKCFNNNLIIKINNKCMCYFLSINCRIIVFYDFANFLSYNRSIHVSQQSNINKVVESLPVQFLSNSKFRIRPIILFFYLFILLRKFTAIFFDRSQLSMIDHSNNRSQL